MADSYLALITPLSGAPSVPGVPGMPLPGAPVYPGQGLPSGGYPSTGLPPNLPGHALPGGGLTYPSTQPLPPAGQPGSPSHPIAPVAPGQPPGENAPPPIYIVVPGYGVVGPILLGDPPTKPVDPAAPKPV